MQMKYRTRIFYTEADKALMWDRWLAQVHVSGRRELPGVTRDDLSKPLHSGPQVTAGTLQIVDLGSWFRDGQSQALQPGD
jgi:hypothetical protein